MTFRRLASSRSQHHCTSLYFAVSFEEENRFLYSTSFETSLNHSKEGRYLFSKIRKRKFEDTLIFSPWLVFIFTRSIGASLYYFYLPVLLRPIFKFITSRSQTRNQAYRLGGGMGGSFPRQNWKAFWLSVKI